LESLQVMLLTSRGNVWERVYGREGPAWGSLPDPELIEYAELIPRGRALDLGVGDGRNAFFLARMGLEVLGVDISEAAVEKCNKRAAELGLLVKAVVADLRDLEIEAGAYACVVCSYVLPFLKRSEILALVERIKRGLADGGFVFVRAFTTEDPLYQRLRAKGLPEVEDGTFYSPKFHTYFSFLRPGELRELFAGLELVSYAEGYSLDMTHDKPHYHGWASLVARKRGH